MTYYVTHDFPPPYIPWDYLPLIFYVPWDFPPVTRYSSCPYIRLTNSCGLRMNVFLGLSHPKSVFGVCPGITWISNLNFQKSVPCNGLVKWSANLFPLVNIWPLGTPLLLYPQSWSISHVCVFNDCHLIISNIIEDHGAQVVFVHELILNLKTLHVNAIPLPYECRERVVWSD